MSPADDHVDLAARQVGEQRLRTIRWSRTLMGSVEPSGKSLGSSLPRLTPSHRGWKRSRPSRRGLVAQFRGVFDLACLRM